MSDTAAHLVDRVLPSAPYRRWAFDPRGRVARRVMTFLQEPVP